MNAQTGWPEESLEDLFARIWETLGNAVDVTDHAWRTPVLASFGVGQPDARIVVLRETDPHARTLACFSDHRARKVADLHVTQFAAWCFYDPVHRVQLRVRGETKVHHNNELAHRLWKTVPEQNRTLYASMPDPGERIGAPDELRFGERPMDNFSVILTTVRELDWLRLTPQIHRRAKFKWDRDAWEGCWSAP